MVVNTPFLESLSPQDLELYSSVEEWLKSKKKRPKHEEGAWGLSRWVWYLSGEWWEDNHTMVNFCHRLGPYHSALYELLRDNGNRWYFSEEEAVWDLRRVFLLKDLSDVELALTDAHLTKFERDMFVKLRRAYRPNLEASPGKGNPLTWRLTSEIKKYSKGLRSG